MAFVLDASVAVSWCFPGDPGEDTAYSRQVLQELASSDAVVPEIWPFEIANAIYVAHNKRKRINEYQIHQCKPKNRDQSSLIQTTPNNRGHPPLARRFRSPRRSPQSVRLCMRLRGSGRKANEKEYKTLLA